MQVYRHLDVGTAKPTPRSARACRITCSTSSTPDVPVQRRPLRREARARRPPRSTRAGGRRVVVGGTGLYIRAFLEGLLGGRAATPSCARALEAEHGGARAEGDPERLHRRLAAIDPETARAHPPERRARASCARSSCARRHGRARSVLQRGARFARPALRASLHLALDPGREALGRAHRPPLRGDDRGRPAPGGARACASAATGPSCPRCRRSATATCSR